jgi:regulator of sigma E protease
MLNILAFLILISIVVSVHEYGHYVAARYSGVKVMVFSIGFGKPLVSCWFRGTLWQIGIIPLGGYVKMLSVSDPQYQGLYPKAMSLEAQPAYKKIGIDIAGPLANFVLASLLFMVMFLQGVEIFPPIIGQVTPHSYADQIGLQSEMHILVINKQAVQDWEAVQAVLSAIAAKRGTATITVQTPSGTAYEKALDFSTLSFNPDNKNLFLALGLSPFPLTTDIHMVQDKSAAQKAGLKVGDKIVAVEEEYISDWERVWRKIRMSPDKMLQLTVRRGSETHVIAVTPQSIVENGQRYGVIGVTPKVDEKRLHNWIVTKRYSVWQSLIAGVKRTGQLSQNMVKIVWGILTGQVSAKALGGPIYIAKLAGSSLQAGWQIFIQALALVSISLGVLNLLPLPILDGGRLLYHSAEWIKGGPLSDRTFAIGQSLSMVVIFLIMALALFNDLSQL